jgi:MFS transporter, PAT family, beta-lactamase induction signal transducer AmpG
MIAQAACGMISKTHATGLFLTLRRPPSWLFGPLSLPFGIFSNGFVAIVMPFVLRKQGVSVEQIAGIVALISSANSYYFLWSPVVDIGPKRKIWFVLVSFLSAGLAGLAFLLPIPARLGWLTWLMFAASVINLLASSAFGGLMTTTVPEGNRGAASGWYQCGNVGGGALGAALLLWLAETHSVTGVALVLILIVALPSLLALLLNEPPHAKVAFSTKLRQMLREIWVILKSPLGLTGLAFFAAPLNSGALMYLFSAVAVDFNAPGSVVTWVTGFGGGLITAVGSVFGGYLCNRFNRFYMYALTGFVFAAVNLAMLVSPMTPATYIWGSSLYLFLVGVSYANFTTLVLDVIGRETTGAATRYSLFNAAGNFPIAYMTWFDGKGYALHGIKGMFSFDLAGNAVGGMITLLIYFLVFRKKPAV